MANQAIGLIETKGYVGALAAADAMVKAAADGARLVVGPKAVLTPLARDKARVLGVEIEKER